MDRPEPRSDPSDALDLAAASVRMDGADAQAMLDALAVRLEEALPRMVIVKRRRVGGFRSKLTEVERIEAELGEQRFELIRDRGRFVCMRNRVVRGITLKRDEVPIEQWVRELVAEVLRTAAVGEQVRTALEGLVT